VLFAGGAAARDIPGRVRSIDSGVAQVAVVDADTYSETRVLFFVPLARLRPLAPPDAGHP